MQSYGGQKHGNCAPHSEHASEHQEHQADHELALAHIQKSHRSCEGKHNGHEATTKCTNETDNACKEGKAHRSSHARGCEADADALGAEEVAAVGLVFGYFVVVSIEQKLSTVRTAALTSVTMTVSASVTALTK